MPKNKGSNFERYICVKLSEWWSNGKQQDIFWRSDSSGGRAKIRKQQGKSTYANHGDIKPIDPIGAPFTNILCIELKNGYGKWSLMDVIDKPPMKANQKKETFQPFEEFMQQVIEDSNAVNTHPILITKRDKRQELIIYPQALHKEILLHTRKIPKTPMLTIQGGKSISYMHMIAMNLDYFLIWCKPNFFVHKNRTKDDTEWQKQNVILPEEEG